MVRLLSYLVAAIVFMQPINNTSNLTVNCSNTYPNNITCDCYRVGDYENGHIVFDSYYVGVKEPDLNSSSSLRDTSVVLYSRVAGNSANPDYTAKLNLGVAKFDKLRNGVYLVVSKEFIHNNEKYTCVPSLVVLYGDTTCDMKFDIEVIKDDTISISVKKEWILTDGRASQPVSVSVEKDGFVIDTVTLSEDNGWSYLWSDMDPNAVYKVYEHVIPDGFVSEVNRVGDQFVIRNISIDYIKVNPQTGLGSGYGWVGVMFIITSTLIIVLLFYILIKGEKKDDKKNS